MIEAMFLSEAGAPSRLPSRQTAKPKAVDTA
jgi:hypothetical protein